MSAIPWCAVCRHPVDELRRWDDLATMEIVFEAWCHGARETVRLHRFDLDPDMSIEPAVAFGTPELPLSGPIPF